MQHQLLSYLPSKQIDDVTLTGMCPFPNFICVLWQRNFNTVLEELRTLDINYFSFIDILMASTCIEIQKTLTR